MKATVRITNWGPKGILCCVAVWSFVLTCAGAPSPSIINCMTPRLSEAYLPGQADCPASPNSIDRQAAENMAGKYAPVLYFHPLEKYHLADPRKLIAHASIYYKSGGVIRKMGPATPANIWKYSRDPNYLAQAHRYFMSFEKETILCVLNQSVSLFIYALGYLRTIIPSVFGDFVASLTMLGLVAFYSDCVQSGIFSFFYIFTLSEFLSLSAFFTIRYDTLTLQCLIAFILVCPHVCRQGEPYDERNVSKAPLHYNLFETGNTWVFNYYLYYAFNGCSNQWVVTRMKGVYDALEYVLCDWGVHESDWERISVMVCKTSGKVLAVQYFQHEWNEIRNCRKGDCVFEGGTHPVGYVSLFSHATYTTAAKNIVYFGARVPLLADVDGLYLVDRTSNDKSKSWRYTGDNLRMIPDPGKLTQNSEDAWAAFGGRWGNSSDIGWNTKSPNCLSFDHRGFEACKLTNILFSSITELLGVGGKQETKWFGALKPLVTNFLKPIGPEGPLVKESYQQWMGYIPPPVHKMPSVSGIIHTGPNSCPSLVSANETFRKEVQFHPAKGNLYSSILIMGVITAFSAGLIVNYATNPCHHSWARQVYRSHVERPSTFFSKLIILIPYWSILAFTFTLVGLICLQYGIGKLFPLLQKYLTHIDWTTVRLLAKGTAWLIFLLNALTLFVAFSIRYSGHKALLFHETKGYARFIAVRGNTIFAIVLGIVVVNVNVALLYSCGVFTVRGMHLAVVAGCGQIAAYVGSTCLDLSILGQFSRKSVFCGAEVRSFCNEWAEIPGHVILLGSFAMFMGQVLFLFGITSAFWLMRFQTARPFGVLFPPRAMRDAREDKARYREEGWRGHEDEEEEERVALTAIDSL